MNPHSYSEQAAEVDIALLLEGSYPFALGGVSAWMHQIIENFPEYTFALICLGGSPEDNKEGIRYVIPKNVTHFQVHYLFEETEPPPPRKILTGSEKGFVQIKQMHDAFRCPHGGGLEQVRDLSLMLNEETGVDYGEFLYSKLSWDYIKEEYTRQCEDLSFIDYFWTIKNLHKPLWKLASILKHFPKARVVHSISTGYAGLLSFLVQQHFDYPVMLTEHGIYTKERKIDIFLSQFFRDDADRALTDPSYLRTLWDRYFQTLAQLSYHVADPIISLFQQAHQIQIEEGASSKRALVIPNGIDIERFKKLRRRLEEKLPVIGFVGRVVPIKDVKGFIRAVPGLSIHVPDLKVWIIGSTDQDPLYGQECVELVENTLLQDVIEFKPHQAMEEVFPNIKILVLSSIRESMPLVILESLAAGVPVVATDVGACKEMIIGLTEEEQALGPAGKIVQVADSKALEMAIIEILQDPKLWAQMSNSAIKRAEKFYDQKIMIEKYKILYESTMSSSLD